MSPEEFVLGATIDSRSTVFNLARMIEIFYLPRHGTRQTRELVAAATSHSPEDRPHSVLQMRRLWRSR